MKRRDFIYNLSMLSGSVFAFGNMPMRAFSSPLLYDMEATNGKVLVLIQLNGGNDGLNTVIPYENSVYYNKRPQLGIKKESALALNSQTGLHPSMKGLHSLYNQGRVSIVQSVGYENPNRSHFRSTDIWMSGSDANEFIFDGWTGRYLAESYPDFPSKVPLHPMAVQLGSVESMLLQSQLGSMGVVFESPNAFAQLVAGSKADTDPPPATLAGEELKFLKSIAAQSIQYSSVIKAAADKAQNTVTYPNTNLSRQLAIVAELISGGLETPVYLTSIGGFDTHAGQLFAHANLLLQVSDAIAAFQADLEKMGIADRVVVMTYSEFGRRLNENGSAGTDHGTSAPMFVVGSTVRGGIIGDVDLNKLDSTGDMIYQNDYRQLYSTVLRDHLGLSDVEAKEVLAGDEFKRLGIFKMPVEALAKDTPFELYQNAPNPFVDRTSISFQLAKAMQIRVSVSDMTGRTLNVLFEGMKDAGAHEIRLERGAMYAGMFLCTVEAEGMRKSKRMLVL